MTHRSKWMNYTKANGNPNSVKPNKQRVSEHPQDAFGYVDEYEFGNYGYGKNSVKLLHVERDDKKHSIREYEVDVHLKLSTKIDYLKGDNKNIVATDSQKNTVYILAKKHGIKSPEAFGVLLCGHFLQTYKHVVQVEIQIDEYPWERFRTCDEEHNHAFVYSPTAIRFAMVYQYKNGPPIVQAGLRGLRILKTTQSAFKDFIHDGYRTLQDSNDRIFSTIVSASWEYSTQIGVDFDQAWLTVKDCIVDKFAGHPSTGIFSPSVQNTLYLAEKMILDEVPQISRIDMQMPNKHYFEVDMSKFPTDVLESNGVNEEVYMPVDKPSGIIYAELIRKNAISKL